jgi:hypothetical protein
MSAIGAKHIFLHRTCPLSGVKRTSSWHREMCAYDLKQTLDDELVIRFSKQSAKRWYSNL